MSVGQKRVLPLRWSSQKRIDVASVILSRVEQTSNRALLQKGVFLAKMVLTASNAQLAIPAIQQLIGEMVDM